MRDIIKISVIFLAIYIIFPSLSIAGENILPLSKPSIDNETKKIIAKKKLIYPKKKPQEDKEEILIKASEEKEEISEDIKEEVFIYPENKPILVQKKIDKTVAKSEILSKKDFKIAKDAFKYIDKKKWQTALKISKKARDKSLYNLVNYLYLIKTINAASFYDYVSFINQNPNFPRISRLKYLAEHKINLKVNSPISVGSLLVSINLSADFINRIFALIL